MHAWHWPASSAVGLCPSRQLSQEQNRAAVSSPYVSLHATLLTVSVVVDVVRPADFGAELLLVYLIGCSQTEEGRHEDEYGSSLHDNGKGTVKGRLNDCGSDGTLGDRR